MGKDIIIVGMLLLLEIIHVQLIIENSNKNQTEWKKNTCLMKDAKLLCLK